LAREGLYRSPLFSPLRGFPTYRAFTQGLRTRGYILAPLRGSGERPPPTDDPANIAEMLELSTSVQYVKGIGPRLAEVLGAKGIHTVDDLLHYLPFRYEDRVNPRGISELRAG